MSYVGGRSPQVGAGGFTLGGGTSPFANKYGWALDNVYEYEVVLANGTVVTASETLNPDLYFALRGGGSNFGIVTAFTVRVFQQGRVMSSRATYVPDQTERALDNAFELFTKPGLADDENMGFDMYYAYNQAEGEFILTGSEWYEKPVASPPVCDAIRQVPTTRRSTTLATMANLTSVSQQLHRSSLVRNAFCVAFSPFANPKS
ncbi:fad binding domain protein [Colletotrichum incanum]|uniref:Fad binding domain protein n=1 Tax=Colletotrichum incanum TaxID=1573173 RepID=A0A167CC97_COLIC|nr:fad binding domain protein [Colletotrichum incanum]